jgi:hypothetical protein
MVNPII